MKPKDQLKDFIQDHREDFDTSMPSSTLWDKIEEEKNNVSPKKKIIKLNATWYKVAAAILLASNLYFAFLLTDKNEGQTAVVEQPLNEEIEVAESSSLYADFTAVELVYQSKVNSRVEELRLYQTKFPEINKEITSELNVLSTDFNELKKELDNEVMDEVIIQAMIENYQIRLQILEDILQQIHIYNIKKTSHEINI